MKKPASTHTARPPVTYAQGILLVILAGVFWSTIGLGVRMIEQANVWQILLYRSFALAIFLFSLISIRSNFKPLGVIRKSGIAGVIGATGLVMAFAGGIYAIQTTTVANAMFLFASAPFLAAFLGRFILQERVDRTTIISMLVALTGIVVMVRQGFSTGHGTGNICALLSALGFAIFSISLRWGRLEDMLPSVLLAGIFATIVSAAVCFMNTYSFVVPAREIAIALSMGVFQVGAGLAVYTIGSKVVPAAELTLLSMTEVLLGPLWVWLFIGETVSTNILIGGLILLIAIAGSAVSGIRDKRYRRAGS